MSGAVHEAVECVKCFCCGLTEECTPPSISRVRDRYQGRWICGLCIEAVKDEVLRSGRLISAEEAFNRHFHFCNQFRSSILTLHEREHYPISAMGQLLRRRMELDAPTHRVVRSHSTISIPIVKDLVPSPLSRSESCFPALSS